MPPSSAKVDLSGEAKLGAGLTAPDLSHYAGGQPALYSLILLAVLVLLLILIFGSLK